MSEVKEKETKEVKVIETTKVKSWLNRVWSAVVGALLAVAAMFGITNDKVAQEKEKIEQIKEYTNSAIEDLKTGDLKAAKEKLNKVNEINKEIVKDVKETVEEIKTTNKEEIKEAAIEGAKDGYKKADETKGEETPVVEAAVQPEVEIKK